MKNPGWTILQPTHKDKAQDGDPEAQQLPPLKQGQQVNKHKAEHKEGKTTQPKP